MFEGVIIGDDDFAGDEIVEQIEPEKLRINQIKMNQLGKLTIDFNKKIIVSNIKDSSLDGGRLRVLSTKKQRLYDIEEVINISVRDADYIEGEDKSISGITLDQVNDKGISLSVSFSDPQAISGDVADLDTLELLFIHPELIIDAETQLQLEVG